MHAKYNFFEFFFWLLDLLTHKICLSQNPANHISFSGFPCDEEMENNGLRDLPHVSQELLQFLLPVNRPEFKTAGSVAGVTDALIQ